MLSRIVRQTIHKSWTKMMNVCDGLSNKWVCDEEVRGGYISDVGDSLPKFVLIRIFLLSQKYWYINIVRPTAMLLCTRIMWNGTMRVKQLLKYWLYVTFKEYILIWILLTWFHFFLQTWIHYAAILDFFRLIGLCTFTRRSTADEQ